MTVCIAALCDDRKGAVVISDQMVTANIPMGYEFQHQAISKIVAVDADCSIYALFAGDILIGTRILDLAKEWIAQQEHTPTAAGVADTVRTSYQFIRHQFIAQTVLEPRRLTIEDFYNKQQILSPQIVQVIDQALTELNPGVDFIIAGPGIQGYTLHTVVNPGVALDHTPIGYCAIGSGAPHAMYSMIEAPYTSSKEASVVEEMVKKAKIRSEVAPGVGPKTQIRLLGQEVQDDQAD